MSIAEGSGQVFAAGFLRILSFKVCVKYGFKVGGGAIDTPTLTPKVLSFRHVENVGKNSLF